MRYILLLALLLASAPPWAQQPDERSSTLVVGKISDDPQRDVAALGPLLDYLVTQLSDAGIERTELVLARDHVQMSSYLRQRKVDWVTETLGMGLVLSERTGGRIVMNRWKYGEREYAATVFSRTDSEIRTLDDLRGHTIAFEHPGSTTGFLLPVVELKLAGVPLALMANLRERPPTDMVGYLFSDDEINTSTWVHKGMVDAGALADTDWTRSFQMPSKLKTNLQIIHTSAPVPRAIELVRNEIDPELERRLIKVLTEAHESPGGREAMAAFQGTTRFERFERGQWPMVERFEAELPSVLDLLR